MPPFQFFKERFESKEDKLSENEIKTEVGIQKENLIYESFDPVFFAPNAKSEAIKKYKWEVPL